MAIAIFLLTLTLVIWQPRGLGIGFTALAGALLAVVAGIVTLPDILTFSATLWNATVTLLALIIIGLILEEAGFWRWLALQMANWGMGCTRLLFSLVVLLGILGTMVLTNVGMTLIWTSTLMEMLMVLRFSARATLAVVFTTSFIADAASLLLPVSNPVNMLSTEYFQSSGLRYVMVMVPVTGVALATSLGVLWFYFQRYLPPTYDLTRLPLPRRVMRDPLVCQGGFVILGLLPIGYAIAPAISIPISAVAAIAALAMLALTRRWFYKQIPAVIPLKKVWRGIPWQLILFSLGMYIVTMGLAQAGMTDRIGQCLEKMSAWGLTFAATGTGGVATLLSGAVNNLPTVLLNGLAIKETTQLDPVMAEVMVYANIIGCTIGAKILPLGSLSTLVWFNVLRRKKLRFNWVQYVSLSLSLSIPVLFLSLLSLSVWLPWLIA
ncbi:MAG TPA: arsenical efflux pump membrane protein ArsB [Cyanobacteria bacterium UBA8803]|nr:arsenical efflux pump membrane protein ArsB [Cyanobacteria bacterium UBA9273]HBL57294.1 arsenical efflux pump membrane protein ArsB [Cyanobacteria bacterium UBA8803]